MKMRSLLLSLISVFLAFSGFANGKDSTIYYSFHDSARSFSFMAVVQVNSINTKKEVFAGIKADNVSMYLASEKNKKEIVFTFPKTAKVITTGLNVIANEKGELEWNYDWEIDQPYRLLVSIAADSANNFILYSGYCWLPVENKWKLLGTCKIEGLWKAITNAATYYTAFDKKTLQVSLREVWSLHRGNTWKNLLGLTQTTPVLIPFPNVDSVQQLQNEIKLIEESIAGGKTDMKENIDLIYYKIINEGTGRKISVTDTVIVHYKGYLFENGAVFDQTKENQSATFALNRLIKGWQLTVPLCRVGGKIKILIPSAFAYSIRTRSPNIPPNSILVFEIEVLNAKPVD